MRIALTGFDGFLGYHFRCHAFVEQGWQIMPISRDVFANKEKLHEDLQSADVVVHFAGVNRGTDQEVYEGNIQLATALADALSHVNSKCDLIFSSSTHIFRDSNYGRAKKECSQIFTNWSNQSGGRFAELVIPHVFGEGGRSFYNSATATFCYQVANGLDVKIDNDSELELIHAGHVFEAIKTLLSEKNHPRTQTLRLTGTKILVSETLSRLREFDQQYRQLVIPKLSSEFDVDLFNSYRFNLFPQFYPIHPKLHTDARGSLSELFRSEIGGQSFFSTTKPGITRGNHFHFKKIERFCVLKGQAVIRLRRLFKTEVIEFKVSGDQPAYVDIPTLHTHSITNTGDSELLTFFWSNEFFDPKKSDTYPEMV